MEAADTILLSRTGAASAEKVQQAVELLRQHNDHALIVTTPWEQLDGKELLQEMEKQVDLAAQLLAEVHHIHHHDHDEHCDCGHEHHHHDHDEHCDCGHEHHHHDHDEHCNCGHEHHHHDHDEHCDCGHEHHHHDHGEHCSCGHDHHADEVFVSWGHGKRRLNMMQSELQAMPEWGLEQQQELWCGAAGQRYGAGKGRQLDLF